MQRTVAFQTLPIGHERVVLGGKVDGDGFEKVVEKGSRLESTGFVPGSNLLQPCPTYVRPHVTPAPPLRRCSKQLEKRKERFHDDDKALA